MAGFGFSEAQEMFRREVRAFVRGQLVPGAKERAKQEMPPWEVLKKLGDMGLLGISIPERYGGQEADWTSVGIAIEEVAKVDCSAAIMVLLGDVMYFGLQHGPGRLMDEWLRAMTRGEKTACMGLTEPDAGADAAGIKMRAVRDGNHYVLDGEKTSVSVGYYAQGGMMFAKTDPKARGLTCFWVPLDLPGVTKARIPHSGMKFLGTASISFDGVHVPSEYRLGEEGKGFYIFGHAVNYQRVGVALTTLGSAQASLEEAMTYALQRTAFGQPIGRFEGVSFKIAEHATRIEAARLLCYRSLHLAEQCLPFTKESAMCKWWSTELAFDAIHDCLLLHGHIGYSEEYPLEQRLRDVLGLQFMDSLPQIMKMIISRELMGKIAASY